jgi:hypothetical protein
MTFAAIVIDKTDTGQPVGLKRSRHRLHVHLVEVPAPLPEASRARYPLPAYDRAGMNRNGPVKTNAPLGKVRCVRQIGCRHPMLTVHRRIGLALNHGASPSPMPASHNDRVR